MKFRHHERD